MPCPVERLNFKLGTCTLALDLQDEVAREVVDATYAPMLCEPPRVVQHSASIRRLADGRLHARFGRHALPVPAAGETARNAYFAAREIFARFASAQEGALACYGASVAIDGAGVLILGPSIVGKTLLALHLAHQSAKFMGDETAIISLRNAELFAMMRRASLRESALELLPTNAMRTHVEQSPHVFSGDRGRFWYALNRNDLDGVTQSERTFPLRAICVIRERKDQFSMQNLGLDDAIPLVAQRAYARPAELGQIAALRKALRRVRVFEVTLAGPAESASAIASEVRACA